MSLDEEISARRAEVRSDGYPMSIGELINLYRDNELDIHPEFQRFFRWSEEQKSRLVESILLGIPIPSIFVSQRDDGVWDVIDGLQRLSTIFELVGILKDQKGEELPPLTLKKTRYLPSLEGKKWENGTDETSSIGTTNRLVVRRSKIDVKIMLRESSESSKYELFQRLNTGGSPLSDQEVRNVILIMVNADAYRWIEDLAEDENFQSCVALSDRMLSEQFNLELVTRFLVFRQLGEEDIKQVGDIGEFLTERITQLAEPRSFKRIRKTEEKAFRSTFRCLAESLGEHSFRRFDTTRDKYRGGFLISAFEPIAFGIGYHADSYHGETDSLEMGKRVRALWSNQKFLDNSGMGVNTRVRLRSNVPLGRELFAV
ncbi:MAG: DUF262 domain-containing protein [Deltaproteobacteria bacterium]|nr:DUF262 domain-containing protein [Deltaproteobacteria bacterium]